MSKNSENPGSHKLYALFLVLSELHLVKRNIKLILARFGSGCAAHVAISLQWSVN